MEIILLKKELFFLVVELLVSAEVRDYDYRERKDVLDDLAATAERQGIPVWVDEDHSPVWTAKPMKDSRKS